MSKVIYYNKTVRTDDDIEALKDSVTMRGISEAMIVGLYWGMSYVHRSLRWRILKFYIRLGPQR